MNEVDTSKLSEQPHKYWFKAKTYGWGWIPATWQGWLILIIWLVLVLFLSLTIQENPSPREVIFTFIAPLALLVGILVYVCYKTGEQPHWQWGPKDRLK